MKTIKILVPCLLLAAGVCQAQSAEVSDEDLKKYAVTMDSVRDMQNSLRELVAERVRSNSVMPVTRYNELFKIADDSVKLQEANATPEEVAFLREIDDLREVNIKRINQVYQDMARDYVGAKTFNTIHKALKSDDELQTRYETISKDIEAEGGQTGG